MMDVVDREVAAAELRSMLAAQPYAHPMEASRWLKTYGVDVLDLLERTPAPCPLHPDWHCIVVESPLGLTLRAERDPDPLCSCGEAGLDPMCHWHGSTGGSVD